MTAEVAAALASRFRPTLVLLGRSPAPAEEPDWLAPLIDETEIKRALATRANGRATPQRVGEQFREVSSAREIRRTLERIEAAGAKAIYRAVDVRDAGAVRVVLNEFGPVAALVHGAGVLADRKIEDLADDPFANVYDTKVAGLRAMVEACGSPRLIVLFSSTTARFGRTGQAAYAAANEVLNTWARVESRRRPESRIVAVNWGPWDGGMVTPALKPLFAAEGVGLIGLEAGARYLVEEISAVDRPAEVVVLGGESLPEGLVARPATIPKVAAHSTLKTVFERPLDLDAMPILRSHVIDGRAVVPMALMLEWLAQGALQRNPGLSFRGVDHLKVIKGGGAQRRPSRGARGPRRQGDARWLGLPLAGRNARDVRRWGRHHPRDGGRDPGREPVGRIGLVRSQRTGPLRARSPEGLPRHPLSRSRPARPRKDRRP